MARFKEKGVETRPGRVDTGEIDDLVTDDATNASALSLQVELDKAHKTFFLFSGYDRLP